LRWLKALLARGVKVNGQIVVCPGVNDGNRLEETLIGILDEFSDLHSLAVVPLGISKFNAEESMRQHTVEEAEDVVDIVEKWQSIYSRILGRRLVHAADEYYIMAGRPFPASEAYEGFQMHEDGIGMARTFELEFQGLKETPTGTESGFFSWVDGAPAEGYRAIRNPAGDTGLRQSVSSSVQVRIRGKNSPIGIITSTYGATVLEPLIRSTGRSDIRTVPVPNDFFGGNIAVSGLLVGEDISRVLSKEPPDHRYLLPDVCLSEGRFLDGTTVQDLPVEVEVIPTDGISLRRALEVTS
jgi:NifB/MoaA-like Fe-S oxidoreductase